MRRALLLCAALLAAWSTPASAQALGERLAACAACHGAGGAPAPLPNSPTLAGQPALFIENQLVMIREGLRDVPAMKGLLDGVSDTDLAAMAKHFAGQPLKPQPGPRDAARFARGEQVANGNRCASCHLPNYAGREQMPRLAGQREDYLLHSMRQFLNGQATGRDTIMAASLRGLSDADLQAMAHHFAQLPP
ncbi:c-type cytochrome [Hydrogenophaga sp. T2]|uniref:c-type cytochrome n=1 Tax=Hydrogenophaga sp. T2 TaxID=3132823 RepID=UPI003CEF1776